MSKRSRFACVCVAAILSAASVAQAAITVTYPGAANYLHQAFNGKIVSTLTPDPVANANEFFLLNGVSQGVQDEITSGDWECGRMDIRLHNQVAQYRQWQPHYRSL